MILGSASVAGGQQPVRGFQSSRWASQAALEQKAMALPEAARAREYMKRMSAEPHHAGSAGSRAVAEYALGLFKSWGMEARIESFEALLPYPTTLSLEMVSPRRFRPSLKEPVLAGDADTGDANQLPTYNAYGGSGDVTAPLVYVNYGVPEDYRTLARMGVDVKGKIVIARYGRSWRGTKPKVAQEQGAAGCIIYSDPKEDGYYNGDVYPKGPYRPASSVQRGSVMDMPLYVGDPLSPGWASEKGSRRLPIEEAATLMKIPVLPVSHATAQPFLDQLGGPVAPPEWRGALPLTYHVGPGPAKVRLRVDSDWSVKPVHNVIARIPGNAVPDEWVIYGNHHDAWVNGANDPVSGAVALLETARSLATLARSGWKPRRTILFALWDAEEFGLIGSTEWVEKHRKELSAKTVAYLNSDTNPGGRFSAQGSPILEGHLREILRVIRDPYQNKSLAELAETPSRNRDSREDASPLGSLGAGSDYVAFVHHLGIPSLNMGFSSPAAGGVYHSIYDSYAWFTSFADKDFAYARTLAQLKALSILRLSEADVLPFDFPALSRAVDRYLHETEKAAGGKNGAGLDRILAANAKLATISVDYERSLRKFLNREGRAAGTVNQVLLNSERVLTSRAGLPGRPWYKHLFYAPGTYTGYSAVHLPAVREALDAGRWKDAESQAARVAASLEDACRRLERLIGLLEQQ